MDNFKDTATIYDLNGNKIQEISCSSISKRVVIGSFAGGGKASNNQTLDLVTKDALKPEIKPHKAQCIYDNNTYIIVAIQTHKTNPIKNQFIKDIKQSVLSLQ